MDLGGYESSGDERSGDTHKENGLPAAAPVADNDAPGGTVVPDTEPNGPILGPARGPLASAQPPADEAASAPASPYTAARQLIHSLTLPPVPNVAIPPSPPGSPPPSTSAKISRFLELKSQGVHFNDKLAASSQLRNPSLLQNLMDFAGVDTEHGQYASTLSAELAPVPPGGFPKEAYAEELAKSQQDILKRKESEKALGKREAVDFVAAGSGPSSGTGTPQSGLSRPAMKGSAAERVMAGLDREKSRSPATSDAGHRRSRFDDRSRRRSRSRSPKRRRDR